jgi:hypothetical protein
MRRAVGVLVLATIAVAIAVVVMDRLTTPAAGVTAVTWHWTGTTTPGVAEPSVVPDPARYTVEFRPDRTYLAVADCTSVPGTFRVIPAGRMGPLNGLVITPASDVVTGCGPGSLAETFLTDLHQAVTYRVSGPLLTITVDDGRAMTFR